MCIKRKNRDIKIVFPSGYDTNIGNLDLNIIIDDQDVYFATIFTLENITQLMSNDNQEFTNYFWSVDMFIVKSLSKKVILSAVQDVLVNGDIDSICSKIGTIEEVYGDEYNFDIMDVIT